MGKQAIIAIVAVEEVQPGPAIQIVRIRLAEDAIQARVFRLISAVIVVRVAQLRLRIDVHAEQARVDLDRPRSRTQVDPAGVDPDRHQAGQRGRADRVGQGIREIREDLVIGRALR